MNRRTAPRFSFDEHEQLEPIDEVTRLLNTDSLPAIRRLMFREQRLSQAYGTADRSLLRHMGLLITPTGKRSAHAGAVAVTRMSAVPLADVVRGVYDFCGEKPPVLLEVRSSKNDILEQAETPRKRRTEVKRLTGTLEGRGSIVVIEQYTKDGKGIQAATDLLRDAGASRVTPIPGKWYMDAEKSTIDLKNLTSPLAAELQALGRDCAEIYLEMCAAGTSTPEAQVL